MDLKQEIEKLKTELDQVEDVHLIQVIKNLLEYARQPPQQTDWWNLISDEEKAAINEGIKQADNGEVKDYSEVRNAIRKKYNL
jgi:predicted transcriptional regulator